MEHHTTTTHQAAIAIRLAHVADYLDRATLARLLARHGVPRQLYTLARVLRAATRTEA